MIISPGSFPGFLATTRGLEDCKASGDPNKKPLASIARMASAFLHTSNSEISLMRYENTLGFLKIGKTSLNKIFSLGKFG